MSAELTPAILPLHRPASVADTEAALALANASVGADIAIQLSIDFGATDIGVVQLAVAKDDPAWAYHCRAVGSFTISDQMLVRLVVDDHAEVEDVRSSLAGLSAESLWSIRITDGHIAAGVWGELLDVLPVGEVDLCGAGATSEMIDELTRRLPSLRRLDLCGAELTAFPVGLAWLHDLEVLEIANSGLTDDHATWFLRSMPRLRVLGIEGPASDPDFLPVPPLAANRRTGTSTAPLRQLTIGRWEHPWVDCLVIDDTVPNLIVEQLRHAEVVDVAERPWCGELAEALQHLGPDNAHRRISASGFLTEDGLLPSFHFGDPESVDTALEELSMTGCIATQKDIDTLARCKSLNRLTLGGVQKGVRLDGLASLAELTLAAAEPFMLPSIVGLNQLERLAITLALDEESQQLGEVSGLLSDLPRLDEFVLQMGDGARPWRRAVHNAFHGATSHPMLQRLRVEGWDGLLAPDMFLGGDLPNLIEFDAEAAAFRGWAEALGRMPILRRLRLDGRLDYVADRARIPALPRLRSASVRQGCLHAVEKCSESLVSLTILPGEHHGGVGSRLDDVGEVPGTNPEFVWPILRELRIGGHLVPQWEMADGAAFQSLPALRALDISGVSVDFASVGETVLSRLHHFAYAAPSLDIGENRQIIAVHRPKLRTCMGRTRPREPWEAVQRW